MHAFIVDEAELGRRVAYAFDDEALGYGALFDLEVAEYIQRTAREK